MHSFAKLSQERSIKKHKIRKIKQSVDDTTKDIENNEGEIAE